jgi:hypothetical protein
LIADLGFRLWRKIAKIRGRSSHSIIVIIIIRSDHQTFVATTKSL